MIPIYPTAATSLYYGKLESEGVQLCELIDITLPGGTTYHWTTANGEITYTLSGSATKYSPFVGATPSGIEESNDLGINIIDFVTVNTTGALQDMLTSDDFRMASLKVGRIFTDTPDLGRMEIYAGQVGDFTYNRMQIKGEARNAWKSINVQWPYYTYRDKCAWRFGGTGCGFNAASVTVALNSIDVASSTRLNILVASGYITQSYSNTRFDFGRLNVTAGANSGHLRTIRAHTGDLLQLSHPLPSSDLTGMQVSIFPGCRKRLLDDCHSLYNNTQNFFGFPWIPVQEDAI